MLYGHVEEPSHRVDHLLRLRQLQDETGGFQAFIPLAFHPRNTQLAHLRQVSGLDRPPHGGREPAAVGQLRPRQGLLGFAGRGHGPGGAGLRGRRPGRHGAPRADPSRGRRRVARGAHASSSCGADPEAGREPVERDSLYRRVVRNGTHWEVAPEMA